MIAPLAAVGLMMLFAEDIRAVFWIAVIPAVLCFLLAWLALKEKAVPAPGRPAARAVLRRLSRARPARRAG